MDQKVKSSMPAFFAVAFVWFTTHFGGGFASGRQLVDYFVKYGWYAAFMPLISVAIQAVVFYYCWKFAIDHKTYDYRSWANGIYSPFQKVFANLFEIMYNLILITATAVAFATGGATIEKVFGSPYIVNTIVIALIIFLLTIFGANVVRKAATAIALALIVGIFIIYLPNVIHSWPKIIGNINGIRTGTIDNPYGFATALWQSLVYAGFQACCLGAYISHSEILKDHKETKKAALWGFIINGGILQLATLGIMIYYGQGIENEAVPALHVVMNGVGSSWMTPIVSLLIIAGAVSTGVNLIYGITTRIVMWLSRNESEEIAKKSERKRNVISSAIYVLITWFIALFGLIPLISKGYGTLGYVAIFVIIIPILIKGIIGWNKNKPINIKNMNKEV